MHNTTLRTLLRLLSLLLVLGLTATACGGDDGGDDATDDTEDASDAGDDAADDAGDDAADDAGDDAADDAGDDAADDDDAGDDSADADGGDGVLQVGIMGECEGAFGGFHADVVAGVELAMANLAGAEITDATDPLQGFTGAEVAGTSLELVGIGCGDDTPDRAIEEIRILVEQNGAEVVFGPLSGDESIAIANYAKDHPEVTFIDGIAGAQETTLAVQAENYFRWHGEGAQWNAGIGDVLHNEAGWDTAVVIADDYSFGWTSAAGFIADFCGAGGDVVQRVFPPLGTTDYSSFIQQLPDPDEVDGYFWVVGGTGTNASLEAFVNAKGDLNGEQHAGNLFFNPGIAESLGTDIAGAYVGGFASLPGDVSTPEIEAYLQTASDTFESLDSGFAGEDGDPAAAASFGFMYGYYSGAYAFLTALENVGGDISDNHAAVREEMTNLTVNPGYGELTLDENRHAIIDTFVAQLIEDPENPGTIIQVTDRIIPNVDQTFGGTFSPDTPAPGRDFPECVEADLPWHGNAIPVVDGVPQG